MDLCRNIRALKNNIPDNVELVAVSKTQTIETIIEAYNCGQRVFGENKAQELSAKYEALKDYDINWHMIGHLQRNKVKYIAGFVSLIHGVDSFKIMKEIDKQAKNNNRIIDCLLQFHIAKEQTKFGFDYDECIEVLKSNEFASLTNIRVCGVMGMASFTDDMQQVRKEFMNLKTFFDNLKNSIFSQTIDFKEISMGMTNDWQIALEEGASLLRIGSLIFGER
jgi:PLP dependent protein